MSIIVRNLCKSFEDKNVLVQFCANIPLRQTTAVMGASGIGKTTLANILLGFEKADGGEIIGLPDKKSAVFQEDRLSENFSALANVQAVCKTKQAKANAAELLCELGLQNDIKTKVSSLSGGMRRRVSLARALCAEYDFLVLDEPFKGLDEATKALAMRTVKQHTSGKTVLLITHEKETADALADHIIDFNKEDTHNG